ncbi:MAG TPA: glycosyltransferase family 1 protein [Steroidobacteraceae bacterium]|jgi:glycosyltransferase involved in cell wall biosynthesis
MARLLDQQDGLGVYSRHVLEQLLTLDPNTHYVIFLASTAASDRFARFPNATLHVMPSASKLWWDQVLVPRAARQFNVDLLFNPKFSLPLFTRIPGVFVLQSCDWYVNPGNYPWWDNLYIRLTLPLYCRKASGLLCISQSTLNELRTRGRLRLADMPITYAGVGPNFTTKRDVPRRDLPERFIFTVARVLHTGLKKQPLYPGGNNERLMRAYRRYRQSTANPLALVVAGRGVREYLEAQGFCAEDLQGVHFLGFVPNDSLHELYQRADVFVLATLCESFGIPILEALSTGCPAIVPNTGAAPEVAGGAARLIDPYDEQDIATALLEVTSSEVLRLRLAADAVARARAFNWNDSARRILDVFETVLTCAESAVSIGPTHS